MYVCSRAQSISINVCIPTTTSLQTRGNGFRYDTAEAKCFLAKWESSISVVCHMSELSFTKGIWFSPNDVLIFPFLFKFIAIVILFFYSFIKHDMKFQYTMQIIGGIQNCIYTVSRNSNCRNECQWVCAYDPHTVFTITGDEVICVFHV